MMRLLALAPLALLLSCAHMSPFGRALLDCATPALQAQLTQPGGLADQALAVLGGGKADTQRSLDLLLSQAGPVAVCAVEAALRELEANNSAVPALARPAPDVARTQALIWLAADRHSELVQAVP